MSVRTGFTLVEILVVVIILGILASIVVPQFTNASTQARDASFKATLRHLIQAGQLYHDKYGAFPAQAAGAPIPAAIVAELRTAGTFPSRTPIGGYWHVGHFADVDRWGVGVWWPGDEPAVEQTARGIDAQLDDGDPNAGQFQVRDAARYYWMIN